MDAETHIERAQTIIEGGMMDAREGVRAQVHASLAVAQVLQELLQVLKEKS